MTAAGALARVVRGYNYSGTSNIRLSSIRQPSEVLKNLFFLCIYSEQIFSVFKKFEGICLNVLQFPFLLIFRVIVSKLNSVGIFLTVGIE